MLAAAEIAPLPTPRRALPVLGHLPFIARNPLAALERFAKEVGDVYRVSMPQNDLCMVNRPSEIERILTSSHGFMKDKDLRSAKSLFGEGLLTSEGEHWKRQRRLSQPAFHKDRIAGYATRMVALATEAADRWGAGGERDVHKDMMGLTLHIATETLFGDSQVSAKEVGECLEIVLLKFEGMHSLLPEWLPLGPSARYREAVARLDSVVYGVIERRKAGRADGPDLLSMLLSARDEDGSRMSDKQLRDEVLTLLLAGHETTANALTWTFHLLSQNPAAEATLHEEVASLPAPPSAADMHRLPYTQAVLNESMRLFPPAWAVGRELTEPFELAGHTLKAGSSVAMSQWVVHRDERFWPNPLAFKPERWLDGTAKAVPTYAYFPFGGGQRMCIGKGFALMEAALVLATLLRTHKLDGTGRPVKPRTSITLRPHGGLPMRVRRR